MTGTIFNIQKFSLHDGPGIRTVVFFKGCPLKCLWCANPESQNFSIQLFKNKEPVCLDCQKAIEETNETKKYSQLKNCRHKCYTVYGEKKEIDDIINILLQDVPFYEESNGGITLSGGEILSQPTFAIQLIEECKKNKLHVAIETTGYCQPETFNNVIQHVDYILYDIKHHNTIKHKEVTGVDNEVIIINLKQAIALNKEVLVRIPVIPTINFSKADTLGFINLFHQCNVQQVQLLPFHQFGSNKYTIMNQKYDFKEVKQLYPEDLQPMIQLFKENNIHAFV